MGVARRPVRIAPAVLTVVRDYHELEHVVVQSEGHHDLGVLWPDRLYNAPTDFIICFHYFAAELA